MLIAGKKAPTLRVDFSKDAGLEWRHIKVRDLWQHCDMGIYFGGYAATVKSHETVVVRLSRLGRQSQSSRESAPRTRSFVPARRRASSPYLDTAAGASLFGNEIRVVLDADSRELWD
jgi:hypothetical protein